MPAAPGSGIDLEYFAPRPASDQSQRGFTFLFAARLLWAKGVAEFVAAGEKLRQEGANIRLQILGLVEPTGPTAVPHSALDHWEEEGAADSRGSPDDVRAAIAAADCVVLPSYYRERVPHILLEAAAMAKPIITTNSPGCRMTVEEGTNGFLCEARSIDSLAESMTKMLALSGPEVSAMGQAGQKKWNRSSTSDLCIHVIVLP